MRQSYLREFEEVVLLTVAILDGDRYRMTISKAIGEHTEVVAFGSVHTTRSFV